MQAKNVNAVVANESIEHLRSNKQINETKVATRVQM
jgi:hypothetical protein